MKPILLVPMAGKGQRFIDGGFDLPKQLIKVSHKTMIEWSFDSFDYQDFEIIFIVRKEQIQNNQIDIFLFDKFGPNIKIVVSEYDTEGTICSCLLAKEFINKDVNLAITTLDVFFQPKFYSNSFDTNSDGCILTFESDNPAYSYSKLNSDGTVIKTAEKEVISSKASVGLYTFTSGKTFVKYAEKMVKENIRTKNEFYICPMYNLMIDDGLKITTQDIDRIYMMGTPDELENFLTNELSSVIK
jgi:dTDP-glucose pyrophosphorylase